MYANQKVVFTTGTNKRSTNQILDAILDHSRHKWDALSTVVCILGMPNVGKSTIINQLRAGQFEGVGQAVGPKPGVTRSINLLKVHQDPLVSILDSPGIFIPALDMGNIEEGLRLAAIGAVPDYTVGPVDVADYLLYRFNKQGFFNYKFACGLNHPTDDVNKLLERISVVKKWHQPGEIMNTHYAAEYFIKLWRDQVLPSFMMDDLNPVIADLEEVRKRRQARKLKKLERQQQSHEDTLRQLDSQWGEGFDAPDYEEEGEEEKFAPEKQIERHYHGI